jgi:hypothetical protein
MVGAAGGIRNAGIEEPARRVLPSAPFLLSLLRQQDERRTAVSRATARERLAENRRNPVPKTMTGELRPFRYLAVQPEDRERIQLVREFVRCGKPRCRCEHGLRHGPYWYLRYQEWDRAALVTRHRREYVPRRELRRVRRWVRRARAETALGWGIAGLLRRVLVSVKIRRRAKSSLA